MTDRGVSLPVCAALCFFFTVLGAAVGYLLGAALPDPSTLTDTP